MPNSHVINLYLNIILAPRLTLSIIVFYLILMGKGSNWPILV